MGEVLAVGVLGILVDGVATSVVFGEEALDFPVVDFGADGELEVFSCDGVPVLRYVSKTAF